MKKLLFLLPLILIGCKAKQVTQVPIHDSTIVEKVIEETYYPTWTIPDSAYWQLAFECDSQYSVLLKDYNALNSGIKSKIEIKEVPVYRENKTKVTQLQVNISALVDTIEIQNKTIRELRSRKQIVQVPVEVPGPEVVRNSGFAKFCIWFFLIAALSGAAYLVIRLKLYKLV